MKEKLIQIVKLTDAIKKGEEAFIIVEKLDNVIDKIDQIKERESIDLSSLENKIDTLKESLENVEIEII